MSKRTYILFGLFAILFAILIPVWAIDREGGEAASPGAVPSNLEEGKELFVTNCGSCHALEKAGTDGVVGPNLDDLLGSASAEGNIPRVQSAVEVGIAGRMPAGILTGADAKEVSEFVAQVAGK